MAQICSKCSHANPPEASYCYYDGAVLAGHGVSGGPVNPGAAPFPSQFVFPGGQICRNFDQLALACQQNWAAAVGLLRQGYLAGFLGGLGRVDLAMAAQEAARFPDADRGLDQLLAKLPTQVLQAPKLVAEPSVINLGVIPHGVDRTFELHLANHGGRLLYGSVVSDCKWMTLGDPPGNPQKLFQFGAEGAVVVQIRGQHLRAGNKPLEGHLVVESNGGQATVTVRAEVPVKPFREGVLAGATSPRQVAEKAKATPKEAAPLFENGAVARWFGENGWVYPVQGPPAQGLGAVQQFFEALGLATAPKVEVTEKSLTLRGFVGQRVQTTLEVKTQERRPVYAHATADQPWLDVSRTNLNGRIATIDVVVPNVPNWPGQTLQATVRVTANGNQRFSVPLSLVVTGPAPAGFVPNYDVVPVAPPSAQNPPPVPVASLQAGPPPVVYPQPVPPPPPPPPPTPPIIFPPPYQPPAPVAQVAVQPPPVVYPEPVNPGIQAPPNNPAQQPPLVTPVSITVPPHLAPPLVLPPRPQRERGKAPTWIHLAPALLLLLIVLGLIVRDLIVRPAATDLGDGIPIDPAPLVEIGFDRTGQDEFGKAFTRSMRFGVLAAGPRGSKDPPKNLTYDRYGRTNNTIVQIDGSDLFLGADGSALPMTHGKWETMDEPPGGPWKGARSVFRFDRGPIRVTQTVELVPGEPVEVKDGHRRFLDTCLVRYKIENMDSAPHEVGLRFLLDTLIGENDGVPFTVPGQARLIDTLHDFAPPQPLPDFIQVLERGDLRDPGLIAFLNLKVGKVEPPDRVSLTRWPEQLDVANRWDVPVVPFSGGRPDSAVVLYWGVRKLEKGQSREVGFSYGLGSVASTGGALGLSVGGNTTVGNQLTVVALVSNPQPGQKARLRLQGGMQLEPGEAEEQAVPPAMVPGRPVPVTWRVRSGQAGNFTVTVESAGASQTRRVTIRERSLF